MFSIIKKSLSTILILLCLSIGMFSECANAYVAPKQIPSYTNTYKEGVYRFNAKEDIDIRVTLLTKAETRMAIFDVNLNMIYFFALEYNNTITLKNIHPGESISIVGEGDVYIAVEQVTKN